MGLFRDCWGVGERVRGKSQNGTEGMEGCGRDRGIQLKKDALTEVRAEFLRLLCNGKGSVFRHVPHGCDGIAADRPCRQDRAFCAKL